MALVPGICTQCGATLSADQSKDRMICPYCGTTFLVEKAINHFHNTYNISNAVVNIYGEQQKEFEIRAGVLERYNGEDAVVTIPERVTVIGVGAFRDCFGLKEVRIPEGVVCIEVEAFCRCTSLNKVVLPDSLKTIKNQAFRECKSLEEISLPDNVTEIFNGAFWHCENLRAIRMPDSCPRYRTSKLFMRCNKLTEAELPNESWLPLMNGTPYWDEYQRQLRLEEIERRKQQGLCSFCGGHFKGFIPKRCSRCGEPKDY